MKNRIIKLCLLAAVLVVCAGNADAQTKRSSKKRTTTKTRKSTNKSVTTGETALAKDTVKPAALPEPELDLGVIKKSLRNDDAD